MATLTFRVVGALTGALTTIRVVATPSPNSRPRVARNGGVFYAKEYSAWMGAAQKQGAEQIAGVEGIDGDLVCHAEIIVAKPKTTKFLSPRGDVDNYAKGLLDGLTKAGVWTDDVQIVGLLVTKRYAEPGEEPGAIVSIGALPCAS